MEEELIEKLKLQDEQAFSYLYDHYSKALFSVIYQMIPQQDIAEDILQQVFLKIWKNIQLYTASKGRLFTWMLHIARNQAIDHTRSREFQEQGKTISISESVYNNKNESAGSIRDSGLNKILEKLPADNRKLLELSYFLGYTQEEIAGILNIPLGTVKTRLRTIIMQLRKLMEINSK
jgi:RNA polymerase sigma-70 factor (ECF subfamily)